jgi:hypothetical protein
VKIDSPIVYFHPFIHFLMLQLDDHYIFWIWESPLLLMDKLFIKNKLAKTFIIKLLVSIEVPINISKDILITIHNWAKGT